MYDELMYGCHVAPVALNELMSLSQASKLPVPSYMVHLVRQYDRPAYGPKQDWRLIMRSEKCVESKKMPGSVNRFIDPDYLCQHTLDNFALA